MVLKIIVIILGSALLFFLIHRITSKILPAPAEPIAGYLLDSKLRHWLQPPGKVIKRSGIKQGMTIMELGCGNGAYTHLLARAVGDKGRVLAIDIQSAMLGKLERKLAKPKNQDIRNIELKQASADDLPFADASIDLVFMALVLPEIPDRGRALREVMRVLEPGGILAVTEFLVDPDYPLRSTTIKLVEREGFVLWSNAGNFWNYTIRFKKLRSRIKQANYYDS